MKNYMFIETDFRGESYRLKFLFLDSERMELTDATGYLSAYIKRIKNNTGLWVRSGYVYGGKYGMYADSVRQLFEQGVIKNKKVEDELVVELLEKYLSCEVKYI